MHRLIFVFIDGIGIGPPGRSNPFDTTGMTGFERFSDGHRWTSASATRQPMKQPPSSTGARAADSVFLPIDATLGVEGLPQSGTGQATLFTGINCAERAGRHYGPFPHTTSLPILREQSLFATVPSVAFANAYPDRFLERSRRKDRWSVTTRACLQAGLTIRRLDDLAAGRALSADLTRKGLNSVSEQPVPTITEVEAAGHLAALSSEHRLTIFEYFHTDKAGHAQDRKEADARLASLSVFLDALVRATGDDTSVLVTSDHGNLEDLSVRTHTMHPVPLAVAGPGAGMFSDCRSIGDVAPVVRRLLTG